MKLNVSNELKSRLMHAAENGSVIAKDILLEVKNCAVRAHGNGENNGTTRL